MKSSVMMLVIIAAGGAAVGAGLVALTVGNGESQAPTLEVGLRATMPVELGSAPPEPSLKDVIEQAGAVAPTRSELVAAAVKSLGSAQSEKSSDRLDAAIQTLEKAAEDDDLEALRALIRIYRQGKVLNADTQRATSYEMQLADLGDADAARAVGFAYARGRDVAADITLAVKYLERSVAGEEHAGTLKLLGDLHRQPDSPFHSPEKARDYYQRAAAKDDPWALLALGDITRATALDGSRDPEALGYYERALALGNNNALRAIGDLHSRTASGLKDLERAADYLMRAAKEGDTRALLDLAKLYAGPDFANSDPAEVIALLEAAEPGSNEAHALKLRGDLHQRPGRRQSIADAVQSYRKAGDLGDGWAMIAWGDLVRTRKTPATEPMEAIYLKAAELGVARAYVRLGDLWWRKRGTKDRSTALEYYQKAEAMGDAVANLRIARATQDQYRKAALLEETVHRYRRATTEVGAAEASKHMLEGNKSGLIAAIQQLLILAGHDIGTPDGVMGQKTSKEIQKFCQMHELGSCKHMSKDFLEALLTSS